MASSVFVHIAPTATTSLLQTTFSTLAHIIFDIVVTIEKEVDTCALN